jgi:hypothetical protein
MTGFGSHVGNASGGGSLGSDVTVSAHENPLFIESAFSLTNGLESVVLAYTSSNNKTKITGIFATVSGPVRVRVLINSVEVRRFETSPLERNALILFSEHRPLMSAQQIEVKVELFNFYSYHSPYSGLVSLEGYIKP